MCLPALAGHPPAGSQSVPRLGLEATPTGSTANATITDKHVPEAAPVPDTSPPPLAQHAAAKQLRKRIRKLLRRSPLRGVSLGIVVVDVATGEEWYRKNPDTARNPASNIKLITSAVALDRLGARHRFTTAVLHSGKTIWLRGDGDPMLTMVELSRLADDAAHKLQGHPGPIQVRVDPHAFAGGVLPPGFNKKQTDATYRSATGAVAIEYATVKVEIFPTREGRKPKVVLTPPGDYVIVDNRARSVAGRGSTIRVKMKKRKDRSVAVITGAIGRRSRSFPWVVRRIEHPPLMAAAAFRALLAKRGVPVEQQVTMERAPASATPIATLRSKPLSSLIAKMNKDSNNFVAEMLLRGLVGPKAGAATWKQGQRAVRGWLKQRLGLKASEFTYNNGSGLYDGGRMSPRDFTRLLIYMDKHPQRLAYRQSLAVAGTEGTLKNRLRGANTVNKVIAKTGTLNDVSALSGYARNRKGRLLAFSIIMNDTNKATAQMRRIQDRLAALLVGSR